MSTAYQQGPPPASAERRDIMLVERFIARAVEAMEIAERVTDPEYRTHAYRTALKYLDLAIEELTKTMGGALCAMTATEFLIDVFS